MLSFIAFPSLLNGIIATGLCLFVWSRNFSGLSHRLFACGMAALAVMEAGNGLALLSSSGPVFLLWKRISLAGETVLPTAWLAFSLAFGRLDPKEDLARWQLPLIGSALASAIFLSLLGSDSFVRLSSMIEPLPGSLKLGPVGYGYHIYLLLTSVLILSLLENTLRSSSESQHRQIKFLVIGVGSIFAFAVYASTQTLLFSTLFTPFIPMQSLLNLTAFGLIAFALVKHRNLEVDFFVSRHVVYGSAILVIVGFYLLGVALLAKTLNVFVERINPFLTPLIVFLFVIGLVVTLASGWVRRHVKLFISEHFYRHKYDFRLKWLEATEKLGSKRTTKELIPAVSEFLKETLGAKDVSVWLYENGPRQFVNADLQNRHAPESKLPADQRFVSALTEHHSPIAAEELTADLKMGGTTPFLSQMKTEILVPLIASDRFLGFMAIGPDITGKSYAQNDYDLLKTIAKQVAYQALNARLSDDLTKAKELEAFHEMSTFVIHDLKNLTTTLSLMAKNAETHFDKPAFRTEALQSLALIVSKLNTFILRLSGLSKTFRLSARLTDLNELIVESLRSLNGTITVEVLKDLSPIPPLMVDEEQIKVVLVNLLINSQEALGTAGEKGTIRIATQHRDPWVILTLTDNGCGMSSAFMEQQLFKPFRTTKSRGLGIGLFETKKIVEAHGGSIDVRSQEGKGTTFSIQLPIRPGAPPDG